MTNEELLAKIDESGARAFQSDSYGWIALRAVVELHKPLQFEEDIGQYKPVCSHCQLGVVGDIYPCETIQIIEKQLND